MATHKTILSAFDAVNKKLETIPNNIAKSVKSDSEEVTPVRTGRLQKGYFIEPSNKIGDDAKVINDVPYAVYVEFGTIHMAPRAMMQQAVSKVSTDASVYVED